MSDSALPGESEPISVVSSRWLWAARCFALICILIAAGGVFHESTRPGATFILADWLPYFAGLIPYLAVLCLLFLRGKNPLAFALGMATATGLLGGGLGVFGRVWIVAMLMDLSVWLFWLFFILSMMLGLSAYRVFAKMRFGAKGKRWIAFGGGIFAAVLVLVLSLLVETLIGIGGLR